jgi:ribosomal protein L21
VNVERGDLLQDPRKVLFRTWKIVVPRGAEAAAHEAAVGSPAQADEGEAAVVGDIGAMGKGRRVVLRRRRRRRGGEHENQQPHRSSQIHLSKRTTKRATD